MQFEQPAVLNRFVDPTIPFTWAVRWRFLKVGLPLLLCYSALLVEQAAFRLWLNDRSLISGLPLLLFCLLLPVVLVVAAFEVHTRIAHRSKRTIKLEPGRVSISPAKFSRIPWKRLHAYRLEPITEATGFSKLTLSYSLGKGAKHPREWSMVLRQADQEHEFISELEHLRQRGVNSSQVIRLSVPTSRKADNRRMRSMLAAVLGIYCLLHGLPLLGAGLLSPNRPPDETQSTSRLTTNEKGKLQRVVRQMVSSPQQFRRFVLGVGGGLTALGAGLYFWGLSTPKRSDWRQTASDLPQEATTGQP